MPPMMPPIVPMDLKRKKSKHKKFNWFINNLKIYLGTPHVNKPVSRIVKFSEDHSWIQLPIGILQLVLAEQTVINHILLFL